MGKKHQVVKFKDIAEKLPELEGKNSKNRRLSEDDKQLNKEMSAIRIEIEHFNAKFKTFQIMSVPYRNRRKRFELRAELICAIINYEVN
ncbi:transposase (IS4 family) [Streptococcus pneumoniae]|nr:transposase (IS4 family) [Streptococcus pneumoniae]